jgi:type IV secretion system protein VirB1
MIGLELMMVCAPHVAPQTIQAIIQVESGGNPLAIGINGPFKLSRRPVDARDAARLAKVYIKAGYSVDLGLMQVNSRNLKGLGYSVEQMFDPCLNMQAGARILQRGYQGATKRYGKGQKALRAALSAYNTGNYEEGFQNGYVAKYYRKKAAKVIIRKVSGPIPKPALPVDPLASSPLTAETTVYSKVRSDNHEQ